MTFLGRPVKPLIFAIAMATATIFWTNVVEHTDVVGNDTVGLLVGLIAGASTGLLIGAWWFRSPWAMRAGLLLSTGVWVARAAVLMMLGMPGSSDALLSLAWALASMSTYWLEATDPQRKGHQWTRQSRRQ